MSYIQSLSVQKEGQYGLHPMAGRQSSYGVVAISRRRVPADGALDLTGSREVLSSSLASVLASPACSQYSAGCYALEENRSEELVLQDGRHKKRC